MNDLVADKKKYIKPITESFPMIEEDFVEKSSNVEELKSYIGDGDDWGDDVIIDPDEEIDW